jgi:hypothetical protein
MNEDTSSNIRHVASGLFFEIYRLPIACLDVVVNQSLIHKLSAVLYVPSFQMISAIRTVSTRAAIRTGTKFPSTLRASLNSMRTIPVQPAFYVAQKFSTAPPV